MLNIRKDPSRICLVRHGFYPEDIRISKEARALFEAGFSVDLICLRNNGQKRREFLNGIHVFRIMNTHRRGSLIYYAFEYGLSFVLMAAMVTGLFFRHRYACIQVNTMPDFLVFITLLPRFLGAKIVMDMHEPVPELWLTKFGEARFSLFIRLQMKIEQWAIRYADGVITVNETIKKRFVERGAREQKLRVVRNVPDEAIVKYLPKPKPRNGFSLITHGTIERHWGHELIIDALPMLRETIDSFKLYVIGEGKFKKDLQESITYLGFNDTVIFKDWMPHSLVLDYIRLADAGLVLNLPSPFAELCQPLKLFEYVALKKPVIIPRYKAIEENFDDSCMMFFEPGNSEALALRIIELYKNPAVGISFAENAYRTYDKIRWDRTKKDYIKIVKSFAQNWPGRPFSHSF